MVFPSSNFSGLSFCVNMHGSCFKPCGSCFDEPCRTKKRKENVVQAILDIPTHNNHKLVGSNSEIICKSCYKAYKVVRHLNK